MLICLVQIKNACKSSLGCVTIVSKDDAKEGEIDKQLEKVCEQVEVEGVDSLVGPAAVPPDIDHCQSHTSITFESFAQCANTQGLRFVI